MMLPTGEIAFDDLAGDIEIYRDTNPLIYRLIRNQALLDPSRMMGYAVSERLTSYTRFARRVNTNVLTNEMMSPRLLSWVSL
jgi:hypothetical protein